MGCSAAQHQTTPHFRSVRVLFDAVPVSDPPPGMLKQAASSPCPFRKMVGGGSSARHIMLVLLICLLPLPRCASVASPVRNRRAASPANSNGVTPRIEADKALKMVDSVMQRRAAALGLAHRASHAHGQGSSTVQESPIDAPSLQSVAPVRDPAIENAERAARLRAFRAPDMVPPPMLKSSAVQAL